MVDLLVFISRVTVYPLAFALGYPGKPSFQGYYSSNWSASSDKDLGRRVLLLLAVQTCRRSKVGVLTAPLWGVLSLAVVPADI